METIAEKIDKLITIDIRLWHLQDDVVDEKDDAKCAEVARKIVKVNLQRVALKDEINDFFKDGSAEIKQYGTEE